LGVEPKLRTSAVAEQTNNISNHIDHIDRAADESLPKKLPPNLIGGNQRLR